MSHENGVPPHSMEAEAAVLGSMLLCSKTVPMILAALTPKDFFIPQNKVIFESIQRLSAKGSGVGLLTLQEELVEAGQFERIGLDYLTGLADVEPAHAEHYAGILRDRTVLRGMEWLAKRIGDLAADVRVPIDKKLTETEDGLARLLRHARKGAGADQLLVDAFGGDFNPVEASFIWEPYLPKGKCVLLDADGKTGKSFMMLAVAAGLSNGVLPISGIKCEPCKTLYMHKTEDGSDEYETVYRANRGVPGMIAYSGKDLVLDSEGCARLEATIYHHKTELVVLDALLYFLTGAVRDTSDMLQVQPVIQRLNDVATRTGCTIVNIRHTSKGRIGKTASELGLGSVAFRNSHRGQLVMRKHPDERGVVVVTDEAGSILVEQGDPFAFRRIGHEIQWLADCENPFEEKKGRGRPGNMREKARGLIEECLAGGRRHYKEVVEYVTVRLKCGVVTVYNARRSMPNVIDTQGIWEIDPFYEATNYDEGVHD